MKKIAKILFTIPNFITAGSGRAMLNIIERLDLQKFQPAVAVLRKGGDMDREVESMGIPLIEAPFTVPAKPYKTLLLRAWKAAQVFHPYRFSIWHSFHYSDDYSEAVIARLAGVRRWIYTKKNMNWFLRSWYLRSILSSAIAAQNRDMLCEFFSGAIYRKKVFLIPTSVPAEKFCTDAVPTLKIRETFKLDLHTIVIGCVAHLVPVKNHPMLIRAISRIPEVHLFLAGKPLELEYFDALKKLTHELRVDNRVHFIGGIQDIPGFLREVDIFVLPSKKEGCPVALLEAMACGKACVATNIPGSRDIIENGTNGYLVPAGDSAALASALKHLVTFPDMRRKLSIAARKRVVEHYSIEREVAAYEALYERVLGNRESHA